MRMEIEYEGDFIYDEREGNGKYNFEDGEYYIGQWKYNYMQGKGMLCCKNGNIKCEGNFISIIII